MNYDKGLRIVGEIDGKDISFPVRFDEERAKERDEGKSLPVTCVSQRLLLLAGAINSRV